MGYKNHKDTRIAESEEDTISIVIPVYNEEVVLREFHDRLIRALEPLKEKIEILYVDDGSKDSSWTILSHLHTTDSKVGILRFSRNFGKEQAMSAGLHRAQGQAIIVIDADLQDPPELIPSMVETWRKGADVINMHRISREGETWFKKLTSYLFYRVLN